MTATMSPTMAPTPNEITNDLTPGAMVHSGYEITLRDRTVTLVDTADAFSHEKTMTTFYRTANARQAVDCWAVAVASIRTDEILMIRTVLPDG